KNLIVSVSCDEIQQNKDCIDKIWARIQSVLGRLYVRQLQTAYALEEPLFDCHIIFEDLCGYKVEKEPYITAIVCSSAENAQQIREIPESQQQNFERIELSLAGNEEDERKDTQQQPLQQHFLHEDEINNKPCSFKRIAVGGTFDHLHAGHKILLTMTAILAQQSMVVGVTDDCMLLKKKHRELIAPTMDRVHQVKHYLRTIVKRNIQYDVVPIKDPFGPTVTDSTIDALVVSKETLKGGDLVNNERDMRGLSPLKLRIIDVISTNDASIAQNEDMDILKISSSWIREYIA
ncbi:hypothetical protein BDF20DRAFT_804664, partial [Mycotypha africana]|uniref:uncharacterized protein n=1 Tax=Mycotypha africana TaxID=64632 RepID=UPI0022FFEFAE